MNHVLDQNQILLRLASVELLDNDGQEIEFAIKRVLSVHEPSKGNNANSPDKPDGAPSSSAVPGAAEVRQLQIDLCAQREDIKRIDSNGFRIVSALDKRASRVEGEVTKLKSIVSTVHRDISGLQQELVSVKSKAEKTKGSEESKTALAELELRLASVTTTLGDVGQQLAAQNAQLHKEIGGLKSKVSRQQQDIQEIRSDISSTVTAADHAQDMAALRAEMAQLRRQMDETRAQGASRVETIFPSRELEVLTNNISKIGSRASQVETLQMELEMLKGRVERAEASRHTTDDRRTTRTLEPDPPGYSDLFPRTRKRAASPDFGPAPKRPTSSLSYSDLPEARSVAPPAWSNRLRATVNREGNPGNEDTPKHTNSAKQGRKPARARTTTRSSSGLSPRLRQQ